MQGDDVNPTHYWFSTLALDYRYGIHAARQLNVMGKRKVYAYVRK